MVTSASPRLRRELEPLKMTSAISPPRKLLALCSPRIQRTASTIFDFPDPFGPTMAVMPPPKSKTVLSAKLLKPTSSSRLSMLSSPRSNIGRTAWMLFYRMERFSTPTRSASEEPRWRFGLVWCPCAHGRLVRGQCIDQLALGVDGVAVVATPFGQHLRRDFSRRCEEASLAVEAIALVELAKQ